MDAQPASEVITAIITILKVPKSGGMNTTKVTVVRWLKKVGDRVRRGEPIVELETEKVTYELDSLIDGVLIEIVARDNAEVPVGEPLCHISHSEPPHRISEPRR